MPAKNWWNWALPPPWAITYHKWIRTGGETVPETLFPGSGHVTWLGILKTNTLITWKWLVDTDSDVPNWPQFWEFVDNAVFFLPSVWLTGKPVPCVASFHHTFCCPRGDFIPGSLTLCIWSMPVICQSQLLHLSKDLKKPTIFLPIFNGLLSTYQWRQFTNPILFYY